MYVLNVSSYKFNFSIAVESYSLLKIYTYETGYNCMMYKKWYLILSYLMLSLSVISQDNSARPAILPKQDVPAADTNINYDELFRDLDDFLDSLLMPRNYLLGSLSLTKSFYNFTNKSSALLRTSQKFTYMPTLGYYHNSGLSITAVGYIVNDDANLNLYQFSVNPAYDYLKNRKYATGLSFTRYFTKDSLPFYTSPLQNEIYAYFSYRDWWIRPTISMSYGWGSRSDYQKRESQIQSLRLRPRGYTFINSKESVNDFSITGSVRHDFYWLDVFTYNDHIRLTPQLSFTNGTQKFGFNQTSTTYGQIIQTGTNVLYNSENIYLDDKLKFQPLSLTLYLRSEYSLGKFFIQPQLVFDYYFPSETSNFSSIFSINAGFMF